MYSRKITKVDSAAPVSAKIITQRRFKRSTSAPANKLKITTGIELNKATYKNGADCPVFSNIQIASANPVSPEPMVEINCPNQMIINFRIGQLNHKLNNAILKQIQSPN